MANALHAFIVKRLEIKPFTLEAYVEKWEMEHDGLLSKLRKSKQQ